MKILMIASGDFFSSYGGGQVYVKHLVDELIDRGVDIAIAMRPSDNSTVSGTCRYREVPVHRYRLDGREEGYETPESLLTCIRPDVVHVHGDKAAFARACHVAGIPCVITVHHGGIICPAGTLLDHRDRICSVTASSRNCLPCVLHIIRGGLAAWPILRLMPTRFQLAAGKRLHRMPFIPYLTPVGSVPLWIREKLGEWEEIKRDATLLVAPSESIAGYLQRNGAAPERISVVPHGIPIPKPIAPVNPVRDGTLRFYFVGRICHVKGLHRLIEAFSGIDSDNVELHVIGEPANKSEQRYTDRLRKSSRSDLRIIWHGKIDNERLYEQTMGYDVMVHPAIFLEVFGLNIAEALASGKPVVATRSGGPEMQVRDGVNGFLVAPNDAIALRRSMERFVNEPALARRMSAVAAKDVIALREHTDTLLSRLGQAAGGDGT
ncbi:MAG: glycosyltransferase family 4 protein [Chlorobiaceae bacterium]|nr:glycosyltransferase family 4 protein [Chlorobiaceae bacterium]